MVEKRSVADVAAQYGVSRAWPYDLLGRYRREGEAAGWPRSRRPHTSTTALAAEVVELIVELREKLTATGVDAGGRPLPGQARADQPGTEEEAPVLRRLGSCWHIF